MWKSRRGDNKKINKSLEKFTFCRLFLRFSIFFFPCPLWEFYRFFREKKTLNLQLKFSINFSSSKCFCWLFSFSLPRPRNKKNLKSKVFHTTQKKKFLIHFLSFSFFVPLWWFSGLHVFTSHSWNSKWIFMKRPKRRRDETQNKKKGRKRMKIIFY